MRFALLLSIMVLCLASPVSAEPPKHLSSQGVLKDGGGALVPDGDYDLTFKIYAAETGGTALWTETVTAVPVTGGLYSVVLGRTNPLALPFDAAYWISLTVDGSEMTPRIPLTGTPYSFYSLAVADSAVTGTSLADGVVVRSLNGLADDVTLVAGAGVAITADGDSLVISAPGGGGGDITGLTAGPGLTGGGAAGDVEVGLDTLYTDARYVEHEEQDSVTGPMIAAGAVDSGELADDAVTGAKIAPGETVRSLNGLTEHLTIKAGNNVSVSAAGDSITISAAGAGGGGDITSVVAGTGLTGGSTAGDATLNLDVGYTDGRYLNTGEVHSLSAADGNPANAVYVDNDGRVGIGTTTPASDAQAHLMLPSSGNFANLRIESPDNNNGFGISFVQPDETWYLGQNLGNWNDARFTIGPASGFNYLTLLPNGNLGLTTTTFNTPFARLQVAQKGDLGTGGLNVNNAAIYVGETASEGMAFDTNQIESVGGPLKLNAGSARYVHLAEGGGYVGINVDAPKAPLHVGQGKNVVFGPDTVYTSGTSPEARLMWLPTQGGALRAGLLSIDGSVGNATGYWDPPNVGWASVAIGNNTRASGNGSVAIGIRCRADNFGSVALGHLSETPGNSAVAAGYYAKADAFVSTAVGAGNVGGGNPSMWVDTDPIFEVGNALPPNETRSNALTVLKNSMTGIATATPNASLHIKQVVDGPAGGVRLEYTADSDYWETYIDSADDYNFAYNGALTGYIRDTDGAYIAVSDRRRKTGIRPHEPVLDRVLKLRPARFRLQGTSPAEPESRGFIAQEVEELFPDLVAEKDGLKMLPYAQFGVLAIKAIQEQQEVIDSQQRTIETLQAELERLASRVERLEER